MAKEVKLLGAWPSPYGHRVKLALKLKGVEYEYIEENLSNKSQLLLESNPVHKKVPTIIHNGKSVPESLVILEYIDETWTEYPLLPKDPYSRATARFWAKFVDEKIVPTTLKACKGESEEREQALEEVGQFFKLLENELAGKEYFGGERIGYLDVVSVVVTRWFLVAQEAMEVNLVNEEKYPLLFKWVFKLLEVDAVKDSVPPKEKQLEFIHSRFVKAKPASN